MIWVRAIEMIKWMEQVTTARDKKKGYNVSVQRGKKIGRGYNEVMKVMLSNVKANHYSANPTVKELEGIQ